jgi:hypothetical protein
MILFIQSTIRIKLGPGSCQADSSEVKYRRVQVQARDAPHSYKLRYLGVGEPTPARGNGAGRAKNSARKSSSMRRGNAAAPHSALADPMIDQREIKKGGLSAYSILPLRHTVPDLV